MSCYNDADLRGKPGEAIPNLPAQGRNLETVWSWRLGGNPAIMLANKKTFPT